MYWVMAGSEQQCGERSVMLCKAGGGKLACELNQVSQLLFCVKFTNAHFHSFIRHSVWVSDGSQL